MEQSPSVNIRPAVCPQHGGFDSRLLFATRTGGRWSGCPKCREESEQAERDERERRDAEVQAARHRGLIEGAAIPSRFVGRTFDTFVADTAEKRHAVTAAREYAEQFDERSRRGQGLILAGKPGTGKSHLAAAILQATLPRQVRYVTCMDVIRAVRSTWRRESERSETQVLRMLHDLDLLVIDEIGVQYGTDGEQTILFDVLDGRYRDMKPTILITNQDRAGFTQFVGERTFDRLVETCRWIAFDWESYRPIARRAA